MSHSPGPWTWAGLSGDLVSNGNHAVLQDGEVFLEADARLIAAAPRMLEMLRKLEWEDHDALVDDDGLASSITMEPVCPCCKMGGPHKPNCELAALLEELK